MILLPAPFSEAIGASFGPYVVCVINGGYRLVILDVFSLFFFYPEGINSLHNLLSLWVLHLLKRKHWGKNLNLRLLVPFKKTFKTKMAALPL